MCTDRQIPYKFIPQRTLEFMFMIWFRINAAGPRQQSWSSLTSDNKNDSVVPPPKTPNIRQDVSANLEITAR